MVEKSQTYYTHGKLLLTGEYLVLQGAKALALPLKLGQSMTVAPAKQENRIHWVVLSSNRQWFLCAFQLPGFKIVQNTDSEKAVILKKIFETIQQLNPEFPFEKGFKIQTKLEFDPNWGLGSSSTLIANLASWTNVDPYQLNKLIFNGSGYDLACANADGPVIYRKGEKPVPVNLSFPFEDQMFFVYSGTKKNSRQGIERFLNVTIDISTFVHRINEISENIHQIKTLDEFQQLVREHEKIISEIIHEQPVYDKYFNDFNGAVKSLGAWGGDFYLVASSMNKEETADYFRKKGLETIFAWDELVLNERNR